MRQFIKKFFVTGFIAAGAIIIFAVIISLAAYPYNLKMGRASYIDKHNIASAAKSPKILITGGSNVNYGINSKILQDSLHMPVIDMSLNASVGLEFLCNQLKPYIKKGDIVLVLPEYDYFFDNELFGGESALYNIVTIQPSAFKSFSPGQKLRTVVYLGDVIRDNFNTLKDGFMNPAKNTRKEYNAFGDFEGHNNEKIHDQNFSKEGYKTFTRKNYTDVDLNGKAFVFLKNFKKEVEQRGGKLVLCYSVYANTMIDGYVPEKIKSALGNIDWPGNYENYTYDTSYLYDSPYHLKYKHIRDRTNKLLNDLRSFLPAAGK